MGDRGILQGNDFAERLFVWVVSLFSFAVLSQIFLAGYAALLAPQAWDEHVAWVHIFQWLSVVLPVTGYFSDRRIWLVLLNCIPMSIIGLQYMLIHMAIRRGEPALVDLHAVGGVLLFGVLVYSLQEWRYRLRSQKSLKPEADLTK